MKVSIIAAIGKNNEIGLNNQLLWHISEDLKYFKKVTQGHVIIMGRKTFDSIGKPLPKRTNIVLTKNKKEKSQNSDLFVVNSLAEALNLAEERKETEVFIIGGGKIYEEAMPFADKLYLTRVDYEGEADTYFPAFPSQKWKLLASKKKQEQNSNWQYCFEEWERLRH